MLGILGFAYAKAGKTVEARKILEELQNLSQKGYVQPSSFPWIYMGLGEIEKSFDWLEKAIEEREGIIIHIDIEPSLDPLRSQPRYKALLRKMNLES